MAVKLKTTKSMEHRKNNAEVLHALLLAMLYTNGSKEKSVHIPTNHTKLIWQPTTISFTDSKNFLMAAIPKSD